MIPRDTVDKINDLSILEVANKVGLELKQKGVNYQACCPIHNEKTPSFVVSPAKNIFKCFGCQAWGGPVQLVMQMEKKEWLEAVKHLAKLFHIDIPKDHLSHEQIQEFKQRETLFTATENAQKFFLKNLTGKPLEYVQNRWKSEVIEQWGIGFAGDEWQGLVDYAKNNAVKQDLLMEAGLISTKDNRTYDFFKGRITFPIHNQYGRIVGFTARAMGDAAPKYLNSKDSVAFLKKQTLFGLFFAFKAIRAKGFAYLVEGAPDVIKMHFCSADNTVAPLGTALTQEHLKELFRFCKRLTFVIETDKAGIAAVIRNAKAAVEIGFDVSVLALPEQYRMKEGTIVDYNPLEGLDYYKDMERVKHDADSYFKHAKHFASYSKDHTFDFIMWYSQRTLNDSDPNVKNEAVNNICELISYKEDKGDVYKYLHELTQFIKPRKMWDEKVSQFKNERDKKEVEKRKPKNLDEDHLKKYGFWEEKNSVHFNTKNGPQKGANFTLEPLFHVASVINSKRLYIIKNEYSYEQIIELKQDEIINLSKFKVRVESLGNFLWYLGESELSKYKSWLYEKTDTCYEITQMGWQKDGFWAWGNGAFLDKFIPTDRNGIVRVNDKNYYLPAVSSVWEKEQALFQFERKFIHLDKSTISLGDYSVQLIKVFGNNAIIGLCFMFATIYRDIIFRITKFFPILNLFGPKGAGKSALGHSLTTFFVFNNIPPNLSNATIPALADVVSQSSNAVVHIDEYKNSIEYEKIEFLKGLWDGAGRTRMNMDRDKKRETTTVDCGIALSGQEMPTIDIALFSRLIFITFHKTEYTESEKADFNKLRDVEKKGLTHLTNQLIACRKYVDDDFIKNYNACTGDIQDTLKAEIIEDRLFRNWLILLATFKTIQDYIQVPFTYNELLNICVDGIRRQNGETKRNNELSNFWSIFEYLVKDGLLEHGVDFHVRFKTKLKTTKIDVEFKQAKKVIIINHTKIFQLYRKHGKVASEKILPIPTLQYYLQNSKEFLGMLKSVAFMNRDGITRQLMEEVATDGTTKKKTQVTTAYVFDYEMLELSVDYNSTTDDDESIDEDSNSKNNLNKIDLEKDNPQGDIPF